MRRMQQAMGHRQHVHLELPPKEDERLPKPIGRTRPGDRDPTADRSGVAEMVSVGVLVALTLLLLGTPSSVQGTPASRTACRFSLVQSSGMDTAGPTVVDVSAKSLATVNDEWEVVTFVYLQAMGATKGVRFQITDLPDKGELLDFREDGWCRVPSLYVTKSKNSLRHALRYVPHRNQVGQDTFKFRAVDAQDRTSTDAVATIDIERGGLRWHVTLNGSTGLSDQRPDAEELDFRNAEALRKSAQDVMFRLDWQWKAPRTVASLDRDAIRTSRTVHGPRDLRFRRRWSGHATLLAGYTQRPLARVNSTTGKCLEAATIESECNGSVRRNLVYGRAFTVGAEVHMGPVADVDAQGTFAEVGATAGAYFDTFPAGDGNTPEPTISEVPGRPEFAPSDYRFESGFRLAFKQMGSDAGLGVARSLAAGTGSRHGGSHGSRDGDRLAIVEPGNVEDLFVFQFLYQRQQALPDLIPIGESGDSRNRLAFRFMATLPVPGGNDNAKFMLGIEASQDIRNKGPRDVRMFYGVGYSP